MRRYGGIGHYGDCSGDHSGDCPSKRWQLCQRPLWQSLDECKIRAYAKIVQLLVALVSDGILGEPGELVNGLAEKVIGQTISV